MNGKPCEGGCTFGPEDIETWTDMEVLLGPKVLELRRQRRERERTTSPKKTDGEP